MPHAPNTSSADAIINELRLYMARSSKVCSAVSCNGPAQDNGYCVAHAHLADDTFYDDDDTAKFSLDARQDDAQ